MKKIILIIVLAFTLTGCSVTYNLELNQNVINDFIEISGNKDKYIEYGTDDSKVEYISDVLYRINGVGNNYFQEKSLVDNNIIYKFSGSMNYLEKEYMSPFSNWCYEAVSMFPEDNIISIMTTDKFLCYDLYSELENVEVNVISKYKVLENNADKVEGNKYTWYIDRNNKDNKPILIKIEKNSNINKGKQEESKIVVYLKYILELTIIIVAMVVIIKFIKKRQMD